MNLNKIAARMTEPLDLSGPFEIIDNTDNYVKVEVTNVEVPANLAAKLQEYYSSRGIKGEDSPLQTQGGKSILKQGKILLDKDWIVPGYEPEDLAAGIRGGMVIEEHEVNGIENILFTNPKDVEKATQFFLEDVLAKDEEILKTIGADQPEKEPDYDYEPPSEEYPEW